ncbi:MAG: NADPH-dependent F420 reductase [Betaproteobacteria bacterium]
MNITIIGAGNMGSGLVKQLAKAGHQLRVTARDSAKAAALAALHPNTRAVPPSEALRDAEVVIVATAYENAVSALNSLGDLSGKVVIDITNPITADYMALSIGHTTSAAEEIAKAIPGAVVVKAFNTVFAQVLDAGGDFGGGNVVPVYIASDNEGARQTVAALVESIGFKPVQAGGLKNARYLEPLGGLNIYFGYGAGLGTSVAPTWISRQA